eukprot:3501150-Prymnesium_polylepis.2
MARMRRGARQLSRRALSSACSCVPPSPPPPPLPPPSTLPPPPIIVNFQCSDDTIPTGYVADSGSTFGAREGGAQYGWDCDLSASSGNSGCRNRGVSDDLILDSPFVLDRGGLCTNLEAEWKVVVPTGVYAVELDFARPMYGPVNFTNCTLNRVGLGLVPSPATHINTVQRSVTVTDGYVRFQGSFSAHAGCASINAMRITWTSPMPPLPPQSPPQSPPSRERQETTARGSMWNTGTLGRA